jgi:hypothetical protein
MITSRASAIGAYLLIPGLVVRVALGGGLDSLRAVGRQGLARRFRRLLVGDRLRGVLFDRRVGGLCLGLRLLRCMFELNRMRTDLVPEEELENAKRAIIGRFALSLEQPSSLLQNIITQKLYNLPADYWDTYPQKVSAITAADVQKAARKYLDMDHLQVVAVGDAAKAREVLAKYGKVEVYDADGKPVTRPSEENK